MTQCVTTFSSLSPYSIGTGWLPKETGHTGLPFRGIVQVSLVWHKSSRTRAVVSRCHRKSCFYNTTSDKSSFFFGLGILGIFDDTNFFLSKLKKQSRPLNMPFYEDPPPPQHTHNAVHLHCHLFVPVADTDFSVFEIQIIHRHCAMTWSTSRHTGPCNQAVSDINS